MNADGSAVQAVTRNSVDDYFPAWSPDGALLAFTSDRSGDENIFAIKPDGSGATTLTRTDEDNEWGPAWSPDGRRIAYTSDREIDDDIFVMNAGGTGQRNVTAAEDSDESNPQWTPSGEIMFGSDRAIGADIEVANAHGSSRAANFGHERRIRRRQLA